MGAAALLDVENAPSRQANIMQTCGKNYLDEKDLQIDYECGWDRIAGLMKSKGSTAKWTGERVEYAWNNGVSKYYPGILQSPGPGSAVQSQE